LFPCPRLVGRDDILAEARKLIQPAAGQSRIMMVLEGQSGFGKSRMLDEIRRAADAQRSCLIRCTGLPYLAGQPFGMLVDAIGSALRQDVRLAAELTAQLDAAMIAEVSRFLPDLGRFSIIESKAAPLTADERKRALVKSFARMLLAWGGGKTLILLLDDFQWVDPGTLEVLTALKEDAQGKTAAIFIGIRPRKEFAEENKHLTEFLDVQKQRGNLTFRHLGPMEPEHIQAMLAAILPGTESNAAFADLIHRKSHGIPLLVEEILKFLIQQERIALQEKTVVVSGIRDEEIPGNIHDVLTLRVAQMDSDVRDTLNKAAVLGEQFTVDQLKAMEGRNEGHLLATLDRAARAGMIRVDAATGQVSFASSGAHDTIYNQMDRNLRAGFHEQAAAITEQLHSDNLDAALSQLTYHYERAGAIEQAVKYAEQLVKSYGRIIPESAQPILLSRGAGNRDWAKETALSEPMLEIAINLARYMRASVQNFRMYPANSEVVLESESKVFATIEEVLAEVDVLSFADAGGTFLVNGVNVDAILSARGQMGEFFNSILATSGLKGVAFKRGLTRAELKAFLELLCMKEAELAKMGGWPVLCKERDIRNVTVNEVMYVQVSEKDIVLAKKAVPGQMLIKEVQARADEVHQIYELQEVARQMGGTVESPSALLAAGSSEQRIAQLQAQLERMTRVLEELNEKGLISAPVTATGKDTLKAGGLQGGRQTLPGGGLNTSQVRDQLQELASMQRELAGMIPHAALISPELRQISDDPEVLAQHLEDGDTLKVSLAMHALTGKRKDAIDPLMRLVMRTNDPRARKTALKILEKVEGEAGLCERLIQELYHTEYRDEKIHLIQALGEFNNNTRVKGAVGAFIHYPDKDTRRAALAVLEKTDNVAYCRELMRALKDRFNWVRADAAASLGHMRHKDAVPELLRLIRMRTVFVSEDDSHVQKQACRALGFIKEPGSLGALIRVLHGAPVPLLFHRKDDQVRAAAAMAVAEFNDPRAEKALARACRDGSVAVRSAAKVAYSRLKGQTMDFT
ncbi:MAG: HEAT repeat domain-containing protein, partial [Candidatus Xenobia bacterium]